MNTLSYAHKFLKMRRFIAILTLSSLLSACSMGEREVLDNSWRVVSYKMNDADSLRTTSQSYVLSFADRNNFSFQLDVNTCGGSVEFKPNNILVFSQNPTCTEACCDGVFSSGVLSAIKQVNRFELLNEQLILTGNNGLRIDFDKN